MILDQIGYSLSFYKPGKPSSLDITLNTHGESINGFQLVFQVSGNPVIDLIDQNPTLESLQIDISNQPSLSFLTNRVKKNEENLYQIELAAITSNPTQSISFNQATPIAKLIFTQATSGSITINQNNQFTKIATTQTASPSPSQALPQPATPLTISTQPIDIEINKLAGQMYAPLTPTPTVFPTTPEPATSSFTLNAPVIVSLVSITLGLFALIYTIRQFKK